MRLIRAKDYSDVSRKAANIIAAQIQLKPDCVLGLATGSSPVGTYKELIAKFQSGELDFSQVKTVNLDEYVGLPKEHSQTYYTFMHENLFEGIEIPEENVHLPLGNGDLEQNCADYEKAMEDYVVDIQLLGIGSNGHIGFKEPGTSFDSLTHVVELKESTRKDNARFFDPLGEEVPTHACTMGIATIMKSRKVLIVANGANKADAARMLLMSDAITTACPATLMKLHQDATVIMTEELANLIGYKAE